MCEDKKIRPVFGIELAVTDSINAKRPTVDHWVFLAQNDIGDINRLTEIATRQFRYQPLLTYEQACHAPGVFKIMGYKSQLDHVEHGTDLFAGLSPACSRGYVTAIKNKKIPFLAVGENVFTIPEQNGFYEVVAGRNSSMQSYPQHILTQDEWEEAVSYVGFSKTQLNDIWKNSRQILKNCTAKLKHGKLLAPERPVPLLKMCEKGAEKLGVNLKDSIYRKRLHHELTLIEEKEYEDYFYIVSDICEFARSRMIVGPARGSSCGSLVCYLLGITTVDPIPHGLIFERFIDINRNDLPDIDIDFSDQHRHMVFKYMSDKYGENRVARLGTVAMYKSRSALSESGAALSAPRWMCDAVAESLIERSSGASRADAFVAVTGSDETNLIACQLAKTKFGVAHTVSVVKDTKNDPLFHILGINVVINSTHNIVSSLEEAIPGKPLLHLTQSKIAGLELISVSIPSDSAIAGQTLANLELPPHLDFQHQ